MAGKSKTALVTGGGSGIGLAVARALVERDWNVAICGRDEDKLTRAIDDLSRAEAGIHHRLHASPADVSSQRDVQRWIEGACDRFGPPALLLNNAGVGASGAVDELDEPTWDRALAINLKGTFLCTREILPRMRAAGGGWIVNIASVAGKRGMPGSSAYCASKFGVVGFTEALAREQAGHGIRATAICPGYVDTPMVAGAPVPAEQMIRPEDVAATVLYLLELGPNVAVREIVLDRLGALG
jgi:NAD(P)-dependent dehydrogenase (short-subunit alcohol dehydrogenase family)